jgi:hypothetical protein
MTEQIWLRQDYESDPSYEAFRVYLMWGSRRSLDRLCKHQNKSWSLITDWSRKNNWRERVRAFDRYAIEAPTDGMVHALAESRDKNLALIDKLRALLDQRLDDFMEKRQDPTIRWTQALTAMAKVEQNALLMGKDTDKTSEQIDRVEALVEKAITASVGRLTE